MSLALIEPRSELAIHALETGEPFGVGRIGRVRIQDVADAAAADVVGAALDRVSQRTGEAVTTDAARVGYDALLIAVGARPVAAFPGALTWWPGAEHAAFSQLLADLESRRAGRITFIVPEGCSWLLPVYELALVTARRMARRRRRAEVRLMTPEHGPLAVFGPACSAAVARELRDARVTFSGAAAVDEHICASAPPARAHVSRDAVVALAATRGAQVTGLPGDSAGFLLADGECRVQGARRIWAVGDATNPAVMHGGLAAAQAEHAARDRRPVGRVAADGRPFAVAERATAHRSRRPVARARHLRRLGPRDRHAQARVTAGQDPRPPCRRADARPRARPRPPRPPCGASARLAARPATA